MGELKYSVKTPVFEGPLELLLELISERKLFVSDVSLALVTDDFIQYLESHDEFPLAESAEFIVVASTLMLIKSRSLLPQLPLTQEEEMSIKDLENRLALYARAKELAVQVKNLYGKQMIFEKLPSKTPLVIFSPDSKTDTGNLLAALQGVLSALPKKEVLTKATVKKVVSLEETIEKLTERVSKTMSMKFSDFSGKDRVSIIVGFLAMLELVKRGLIDVKQQGKDIEIISDKVSTPNYA